jgi:hypothetical protein
MVFLATFCVCCGSNIFSLCTCVTETVLLYIEVLCYFLNFDSILMYMANTDFTCV